MELEEGEIEGEVAPQQQHSDEEGDLLQLKKRKAKKPKKGKAGTSAGAGGGTDGAGAAATDPSGGIAAASGGALGGQFFDVYGGQDVSSRCMRACICELPMRACVILNCWLAASQARASAEVKTDRPVRLPDVQRLVLWILADEVNPTWVFIKVRSRGGNEPCGEGSHAN
jgi:hypothetical protein